VRESEKSIKLMKHGNGVKRCYRMSLFATTLFGTSVLSVLAVYARKTRKRCNTV